MKQLLPALLLLATPFAVTAQNTCATALDIGLGLNTASTLVGEAPQALCVGNSPGNAGAWFRYTAEHDTSIYISTYVQGYPTVDTRMHIYTGTCGSLVCHASDDDSGPGYTSITTFWATAGTSYLIAFDSYWTANGFTFELVEVGVPAPPENLVTFTSTSIPGFGNGMAIVDMNNDGRDDAVAPGSNSFQVAYALEGGGFSVTTFPTSTAANTASWSFAIGDWDSNGYRDLLYGGGSGATFMKADATGQNYTQITFPQYLFCQRTNFVDINNDGHLDAFSCHDVDANVAFMNDGAGNLVWTQGGFGPTCGNYGSIWTDMDNDGDMDLFIAKCGCDPADLMMINDGEGNCTNIATAQGLSDGHQSWSSAWADYDNDGDMDVLIGASSSGFHKLLRNDGSGNFENITVGSGMDLFNGQSIEWTAHDFNNDGYVDIMGGGAIHYNLGNMTFSPATNSPGNHAVGDLNGDGFLDILSGGTYFRNNGNDNNWIKVMLQGVVSNRDAIGARVTITSALGSQIREVRSGDGFRYMSYLGANFGIGEDTEISELRIDWPRGQVDIIENPTINTTHMIVEGISTGVQAVVEEGLQVFPSPAVDHIMIKGVAANAMVSVHDASGKLVYGDRLSGGRLSVGTLAPGTYQVRIVEGDVMRQARFSKQ